MFGHRLEQRFAVGHGVVNVAQNPGESLVDGRFDERLERAQQRHAGAEQIGELPVHHAEVAIRDTAAERLGAAFALGVPDV